MAFQPHASTPSPATDVPKINDATSVVDVSTDGALHTPRDSNDMANGSELSELSVGKPHLTDGRGPVNDPRDFPRPKKNPLAVRRLERFNS